MMGLVQDRTAGGTFFTMMGLRKTVPSSKDRIVALGLGHCFLRLYSFTRAAFGVMVAHLTPTWCFLIASAASTVTLSSVSSRCLMPRSKYLRSIVRCGRMSFSLI